MKKKIDIANPPAESVATLIPKRVKKESKRSMEQHLSTMAAPQR